MVGGYAGRILRVNLAEKKIVDEPLDLRIAYNFLGGRGYGAYILYKELKPKVDPLSQNNKIVVMTGPLTGTMFPGAGRTAVCSKSPLTGTIADSLMGGSFGVFLKRALFDGIIIEGKAEKPVYLVVEDGEASLEDAGDIWSRGTAETKELLLKKHPGSSVAAIGPAGENLCRFSTISSGGSGRDGIAGRCGMGTVMGSKNLKAIVACGSAKIEISDEKNAQKLLRKIRGLVENHPITGSDGSLARFGTGVLVHKIASAGLLPSFNFSNKKLDYKEVDPFSGETVKEKYLLRRTACFACPTACGRWVRVGVWEGKGPEFESVAMLGPNAGFFDYEKEIVPLSNLCDDLGLDTISAGALLGYLRKAGKITSVGDAVKVLQDAASGKSLFSLGLAEVAKKIRGPVAPVVKGLEMPAYDPRGARGIALAYATSNRGACHLRAYTIAPEIYSNPEFVDPSTEVGKASLVKKIQDAYAVYDSLVACKFHSFALFATLDFELDDIARLLTAVTGLMWTGKHLKEVGARIYSLERMFNVREGFTAKDDSLPKEFGINLQRMLSEYYRERGWSASGVPKKTIQLRNVRRGKLGDFKLTPLEGLKFPQLQVALDLDADLSTIEKIAKEAYAGGARIIEAGTPAIKRHGVEKLLPRLRKAAPEAILVADLKTMDVGNLEARIAFRAGADISAVLAIGGKAKIVEAVGEAIRWDRAILIDFIDCQDPLAVMEDLAKELVGHEDRVIFCIHRGISEQLKGRGIHEQAQLIAEAKKIAGRFPLAVAGGIKEGVAKDVAAAGADICIAGGAIYNSADPREAARRILKEIVSK
ncbi:MAG: orotidine 5'-phosphate decarboxylase / HUMPS family protein [Candidatus Hadarchaeales archaeon]